MQEKLTFEAMPQAILELMHKVDSLRADIGELKRHCHPPQVSEPMIGIDEACKILGRAKSTVYALTPAVFWPICKEKSTIFNKSALTRPLLYFISF